MPSRLSGKGVKSGGPPVFSVEFFIANHADIVSTFCTLVFIGLVFQVNTSARCHTRTHTRARTQGGCISDKFSLSVVLC